MSDNITAFTAPGATYPPYVSINERDGQVEITVRGAPTGGPVIWTCGSSAAISMSRDDFSRLVAEASVWLEERGR